MYVTLEPCCHHGKQPPCVEAVIEAGIKRVYVGSDDPNPLVAGGGIKILKEHGIEVVTQVLKDECDRLNEVFFYFIQTRRPYVAMKYAMTMDGKIATHSGLSKWITGEKAREHVQNLRHRYKAIMAGIGTVLADDPLLTCRIEGGVNPIRIICDTHLKLPLESQIVNTAKEVPTDIYNAIDQRSGRLDIVGKTYAVRGAVTLASFTLTLWLTQDIVLTLALMLGASLVVFFVYSLPQARAFYAPEQPQNARVAALLWECLPLAVYSFLNTTTASIPKLALSSRMGETALGIYGPVTQPVVLLQVGATYLFNPFITVFADSYARRDKKGFFKAVFAVQGIVLALLPLGLAVAHFLGRWGLATFVSPGLADYQYLLGPMVVSAILTALVLFYSMVLTVMRCMKGLIVANVCAIAVSALASGPCIARWELQGTTYAAVLAQLVQLVMLGGVALRMARRHFAGSGPLPKPEDPFDGLPS